MFYQHTLLKKKGQFGIIWLAAHCPSKITKHDVVTLNLVLKCKEIMEFVTNGHHKKPRFSLQLSAHLMFGLVVLLNRQLNYLYNDLILFQNELKPVVLKPAMRTPKKARRVEKAALAVKENLPEDSLELDLAFEVPMEIPFDFRIPTERIRDITLTEMDADKLTLLYPIPEDRTLFEPELPPLPSEFLPASLFEKPMVTSTVRKPSEARPPFGEIDLNRMKERKKRPLRGEDTFEAIERLAAEEAEIIEPILEPGLAPEGLGETTLQPVGGRELFEITGVTEHPPAVTEITEAVPTVPSLLVPELPTVVEEEMPPAAPEVPKVVPTEKAAEVVLELKRPAKKLRVVSKRKLIIDEIKEISDKEMIKRSKHVSVIQRSDIEKVTISNKPPFVDLFEMNNRDMRRAAFLSQRFERRFNIQAKQIHSNYVIEHDPRRPFYDISRATVLPEEVPIPEPEISERLRESSIQRRRAEITSILAPPERVSSIRAEESPKRGPEISLPPAEIEMPQMPPPETFVSEICEPLLPPTMPVMFETEKPTSFQTEILDEISAGKKYFHEIIPTVTTKKKKAAGMFASLLHLCAARKIKATQSGPYEPIALELINEI